MLGIVTTVLLAITYGVHTSFGASVEAGELVSKAPDPCAAIAGKKWVAPAAVRACFKSFKVNPVIKANIIDVVNKTLAFHTSVNYQVRAPQPFTSSVHEDLQSDFSRIRKQHYASDYDLHLDMSETLRRLNDGHCVYINNCYDAVFVTYLPIPLVLLTDAKGAQTVHIAPEAFQVASAEFADEIQVWQNALPGPLKGKLASLSGAKVLKINGADPFAAVNANAQITGSFQGLGTRQNSFFASYGHLDQGWQYFPGTFAQLPLPLTDSATLTIQRVNSTKSDTITLPYRSRVTTDPVAWTDAASYWDNNCVATPWTNGYDINSEDSLTRRQDVPVGAVAKFRQMPTVPATAMTGRKHGLNVILDSLPLQNIALPPALTPPGSSSTGSSSVTEFHMLPDKKTGILALGSFSDSDFVGFQKTLRDGLVNLKRKGATQLIVDVSNNGGGYICIAHFLHRIIAGPKRTTEPQAGLDTMARNPALARLITKTIASNTSLDPNLDLLYNPLNWRFPNNTAFSARFDWLKNPVNKVINGRHDQFSLRMADICQPFDIAPPATALFNPKKVAIVSNGRCASSCSLFSITMAKEEGSKTVVYGGKKGVQQQYCGTVGGQSTDFSTIDTEIKSTHHKDNPAAPPDFLTNSIQGITWRLGFGIDDPTQPEEWQDHPADFNLPLTPQTVNNPMAIWQQVVKTVFK